MADEVSSEPARDPQDLERLLVSRERAGDVDGMAALYEPHAVLDCGGGRLTLGMGDSEASAVLSREASITATCLGPVPLPIFAVNCEASLKDLEKLVDLITDQIRARRAR